MIPRHYIIALLIVVGAIGHNASAQTHAELQTMVQQLQADPSDTALRERIIQAARTLKPAPAIPEEARAAFVEGAAIARAGKDASQQKLAADSFQAALQIAPWWGDAYYNLAIAQELAGQLNAAQASLKLYILTNPAATEARAAQDRIYELNARIKLASSDAAAQSALAAVQAANASDSILRSLDGAVFIHRLDSDGYVIRNYTLRIFGDRATETKESPYIGDPTKVYSCALVNLKCELQRNEVAYSILEVQQSGAKVYIYRLNGGLAQILDYVRQR